jgi:hypothetical protein
VSAKTAGAQTTSAKANTRIRLNKEFTPATPSNLEAKNPDRFRF